jgi:hypothetical protein
MPKNSKNEKGRISPPEEVIGILCNSRDLAIGQQLTQARDVIRAASIVATDFHLNDGVLFERLSESVMSKPCHAIAIEFDNAFSEIRSLWNKIAK